MDTKPTNYLIELQEVYLNPETSFLRKDKPTLQGNQYLLDLVRRMTHSLLQHNTNQIRQTPVKIQKPTILISSLHKELYYDHIVYKIYTHKILTVQGQNYSHHLNWRVEKTHY